MKTEDEIISHNMQVSLKAKDLRPRFSTISKFDTDYTAKCKTGKHILKSGLGFLGVGSMWFHVKEEHLPILESLPVKKCSAFGISDPCE